MILRTNGGVNLICLFARDVQAQDATWRSTDAVRVKRKVHANRPRAVKDGSELAWNEGTEESGRSHGRFMWCTKEQEYMDVMKMPSAKLRRKPMASSSRLPVRRERKRS